MIFNQRRLGNLPQAFDMAPVDYSIPSAPMTQEPFYWGAGGARMSPEEMARRQQIASNQMQADFSPVGSMWEGLGRVVNNVSGALQQRKLDKEGKAQRQQSMAVAEALAGGGASQGDLIRAASDPTLGAGVNDVATLLLKAQQPKQRNPFEFEQMLEAGGYQPGTPEYQAQVRNMITAKNDPFVTATLPTGDFFAGRQSAFGQYLKGGDQTVSPSPGAVVSPPPASAGPGVPHLTVDQMGAFGSMFPQWQKREGTPVLVTSAEEMARVPVGTLVISPDGRRGVKK